MDKIIFATDLSAVSAKLLEYGGKLASKAGAELIAAHALKPPSAVFKKGDAAIASWQASNLRRVEDFVEIPELASMNVGCRIAVGDPETSLVRLARDEGADLLILAKRSRSTLERFFVGSVTERIAAVAPFPVVVVPDAGAQTVHWNPILCVTDFSAPSKRALGWAIRQAEDYDAALAVLTVVDFASPEEADRSKAHSVKEARENLEELLSVYDAPKGTRALVAEGTPADTILEQAAQLGSDLIVIGRRGKAQGEYVGLGSTADTLLKRETVPLAIIP